MKHKPKEFLTCTRVLNIMTILGFMANYMLRVNLSIAVVDMLNISTKNATVDVYRFDWDVMQKNNLLGAFFWGYTVTDIIGGRLSEILGSKLIFGGGMLLASLITILMPGACYLHFYAAIASRVLLGMFLGVTYPCIAPLAIKWIPPTDRSKFLSNMMSQGLGVAISLPICGLLISLLGWPSVFYVTGFVGVLWSCFWFYLVYDSPQKHPRISDEEKFDIESKIGAVEKLDKPKKLPWGKILLSAPAWAVIFSHGAVGFIHFLNITQLPTYMMDVLHFDITKNGIWSSLPNLGQYLVAIAAGFLGDVILKSNRLSLIKTRKLFAGISTIGPAIICAFLAVYGENPIVALFSLVTSISLVGAISAGHLPNSLDISPNFCGTIMGIATTVSSIAGWSSTKIVGVLTEKSSTFDSWKNVFWTMSGVSLFGGLFFIIFAKGEVQKWNFEEGPNETTNINKKNDSS